MGIGYEQFVEEPAADKLTTISRLADEVIDLDSKIAAAEKAMEDLQKARKDIAEHLLPDLFTEIGVTEITTDKGVKFVKNTNIRHSVSKANKEAAFAWLEEHGQGGMIKNAVVVSFNKGQEGDVKWFLELIDGAFPDVRVDKDAAPASVGAFLRNEIKEGREVPEKTFGIFKQTVVEIA